jgi:hypothetical protein
MPSSKILVSLSVWLSLGLSANLTPREFSFQGPSNHFLTPNGDGHNDNVVLVFSNPRFSAVSGTIYDSRGRFVANMSPGADVTTQLVWNGRSSGGEAVRSGVYIYSISCEGTVQRGVLVVIR